MAPWVWSEITFFVRIEDTLDIAFIRCKDLPQPCATETVPSILGIKELFAQIAECCRTAKPIEATHVLYDPFDRPIGSGELLRQSLTWLVEDIGCSSLWTVRPRDRGQRTFADSSTQTSEPCRLRPSPPNRTVTPQLASVPSSPTPIVCTSHPLDAPIPDGPSPTASAAPPIPTSHSLTAIDSVSVPAPEQAPTSDELSTSERADLGSPPTTARPPLEPTNTSSPPHTSEPVDKQDAGKAASPARSLPLRERFPTPSQGLAEVDEPDTNRTPSSAVEDPEHQRTIKKARITGNGTAAAAKPTKTSNEDSTQLSTSSATHCADDSRYRKRLPTFDAEGAARLQRELESAGASDRDEDGADADRPIDVDGTAERQVDSIDDDLMPDGDVSSEEVRQQEVIAQTGYDSFDRAMAKDGFDQWDPAVWPVVCDLFQQPEQERHERHFTHVHWLRRAPYDYQGYGAYFLLMAEIKRRGVLLADEMGLGKTMTVVVALATISTTMRARHMHQKCTSDACTGPVQKRTCCPKSPLSPLVSRHTFPNLPTLVIVPTGAINMWEAEFQKSVTPTIVEVRKTHGDHHAQLDDLLVKADGKPLQDPDRGRPWYKVVVLTTKESLRTRIMDRLERVDGRKRVVARLKFARVIVDESHEIRNVNTHFVRSLRRLSDDGKTAMWFMTGTPLPKGPGSVKANFLCWSRCGGSQDLVGKLDNVLSKYNSSAKKLEKAPAEGDVAADRGLATQAECLAAMLKPYMLQRTAETRFRGHALLDVPRMSSKLAKLDFVGPWGARWQRYYQGLQGQIEQERIQRQAEALRTNTTARPVLILNLLRMARIYAGIPGLMALKGNWTVEDIKQELAGGADLFNSSQLQDLYDSSAKLQALVEECRRLEIPTTEEPDRQGKSSEKMVIFASTPIEAHIIDLTLRKIAKVASRLVEQSMRPPVRLSVINNSFQGITGPASFDVLVGTFDLIAKSYTMVNAQTAILFGPEWVEATEKQAQYRIKRIGQARETRSIRYQMKSSIEGLIVLRQQYRATFDDRVLGHNTPGEEMLPLETIMKAVQEVDAV